MRVRLHRGAWAVLLLGSAWAQPLPGEGDEGGEARGTLAVSARGPLSRALGERFAGCYEAQSGPLAPGDRALVVDALGSLAVPFGASVAGAPCDEDEAGLARCVAAVQALGCEDLARRLSDLPSALAPPPPSWAVGYARTLARAVSRCYQAELDAGLSSEDREALEGFEKATASAVGALTAGGGCSLRESALSPCALSLEGLSCEALAGALTGDAGVRPGAITPACAGLLACSAEVDAEGDAVRDAGARSDARVAVEGDY